MHVEDLEGFGSIEARGGSADNGGGGAGGRIAVHSRNK